MFLGGRLNEFRSGPRPTGVFEGPFSGRGQNLRFRHDVVRVWLQPPERLLAAGLPLSPLAPVSNAAPERLPEVLTAVAERLQDEAGPVLMTTLWAATAILRGVNHPKERVEELANEITTMVLGIRGIEQSSVYQDIFAKGEARGETKGIAETLLRIGRKTLGTPDERVQAAIMAIADRDRLNQLSDRVMDASTWDELLASVES